MLIGIDGNEANVEKKVGIGQYAYNLLSRIRTIGKDDFCVYLKDQPRDDMPKPGKNWNYKVAGPKFLWTKFALPLNLFRSSRKPNVFFSPSHYSPSYCSCPTAISIMDLSYVYYPQMFKKKDLYQLTHWTKESIRRASVIFTISNFSKKTIVDYYKVSQNKIIVTYPGINEKIFNNVLMKKEELNKKLANYGINKEFILFVGTIQPRKNIVRLISAFEKIAEKRKDLLLVIIGKKGWLFEDILKHAQKLVERKKIMILDYVMDNDLPLFYKSAQCLVLPSLYEGFGIPVIEAMSIGCPVIASNVTSLPEIIDDCGVLIDPESIDSIESGINKILTDDSFRNELIQKGLKRAEQFSWIKCANDTLTVLREIGRQPSL